MDTVSASHLFPSVSSPSSPEQSVATSDNYTTQETTADLDPLHFRQMTLLMNISLVPILVAFGLFGNVMIMIIVARLWRDRSTLNIYFLCLAVSDSCFIFTGPLDIWLKAAFQVNMRGFNEVTCKLYVFILNMTGGVSSWILVALVVERALSVVWPHRVGVMCTVKKTWIIICTIVIVLSLVYSHCLYGVIKENDFCTLKADYLPFVLNVFVKVDLFLFSFVPLCGLSISSIVLVVKLRSSVKRAGDQFAASREQQKERRKQVNATSRTALLVSVSFMVFTIPLAVWNAVNYLPPKKSPKTVQHLDFEYFLQGFLNCLAYFNYSMNFYLYCLTGQKFRNEFRKIMCGLACCIRPPKTQSSD